MKKKILLVAVALFSMVQLSGQSLNLANFTCSPITYRIWGSAPPPTSSSFIGSVTLAPITTMSYSDAYDFVSDPGTYDVMSNGTPAELAIATFDGVRGWDIAGGTYVFTLSPGDPLETSLPYVLPCSGTAYQSSWPTPTTIIVQP